MFWQASGVPYNNLMPQESLSSVLNSVADRMKVDFEQSRAFEHRAEKEQFENCKSRTFLKNTCLAMSACIRVPRF